MTESQVPDEADRSSAPPSSALLTDAEYRAAVIDLLDVPERAGALGESARDFVLDRMSWPAMLAGLPALMGHD